MVGAASEEELPEFVLALEGLAEAAFVIDVEGRIRAVNTAAGRLFGEDPAAMLGTQIEQWMPQPHRARHDSYVKRYLATGERRIIGSGREVTACRRDGSPIPVYLSVGQMDVAGERCFLGVLRDLTAQKKAEAEVQERDALLSCTQEQARLGTWSFDPATQEVRWSDQLYHLHGLPVGSPVDMLTALEHAHPDDRGMFARTLATVRPEQDRFSFEYRLIRANGIVRWLHTEGELHREHGTLSSIRGFTQDVTALRETMQALEQSRRLAAHVGELSPEIVAIVDATSQRIVYANPSALRFFGMELAEMRSRRWPDLAHGDDLVPMVARPASRREAARAGMEYSELRAHRADGEWRTLRARSVHFEFARDGAPLTVLVVAEDITDGRAVEEALRRAREELAAAERVRHELLAHVSHELRTPLHAIIGFSDALVMGVAGELGETQHSYSQEILSAGGHLLALIDDILDLSVAEAGRMAIDRQPILLGPLVAESIGIVAETARRHRVEISTDVEVGDEPVYIDPVRVRQILWNLLANAIKFTEPSGRVTVTVRTTSLDGAPACEIAVQDTGIGIPQDQIGRLFQPFTRLSNGPRREGKGLGLAIVRRLVELHGGAVRVHSSVGQGSTFSVVLPTSADAGGP